VVGPKTLHKDPWDFAVLAHVFSAIPHMNSQWYSSTTFWDETRENCAGLRLLVKGEIDQRVGLEATTNLYKMVKAHARRCEGMIGEVIECHQLHSRSKEIRVLINSKSYS